MRMLGKLAEETAEVLPGGNTADWSGQNVVEHQRGNAEFREYPTKRLLYGAIDAAADKHAAAFNVDRAHGIRKQHDGQDEPRRGLSNVTFGFTTGVVGRGGEVVQNNGRGTPERNEGQEGCRGDDDTRNAVAPAACGSRAGGSAAHVWISPACRLKCSHFSSMKSSAGNEDLTHQC